jgi:hypothetical protein
LVKKWYEFRSTISVQRAFKSEFKSKDAPAASVIKNLISKFEKTGSVSIIRSKEKTLTPKRQEAKNQLEMAIADDPSLSSRKAASALGVSQTFVLAILHDDFHLKPYKLQQWHRLEPDDYQKRVDFVVWCQKQPKSFPQRLICCDEAYLLNTNF